MNINTTLTPKDLEVNDELSMVLVPNDVAHTIWDPIESMVQKIVDKAPDDVSMKELYDNITSGNMLLVLIIDKNEIPVACNVLDVRITSTGMRYLMIPITAGTRMKEWLDAFMKLASKIAIERDCKELRGMSIRKGWLRALAKHGWEEVHTTIKMKL